MKFLSILATRCSSTILGWFGRGGSLPGSIGLKIDQNILSKLQFSGPLILVTGTNGKTSTTNLISDVFEDAGYHVITNRKGDNMKPGIVTSLLSNTSFSGKIKADAIVLEVDELNIRHVLPNLPVTAFVVNNFFRDQLDRAKEMDQLIGSIESVLDNYKGLLILNGNDPNVVRLSLRAKNAKCMYFGLAENDFSTKETSEANEGKFCPKCGHHLKYSYYQYSHIGHYACTHCDFKTPPLDVCLENIDLDQNTFVVGNQTFTCPFSGMYSMYNCAALFACAKAYDIHYNHIETIFKNAPQPKGRNEKFISNSIQCILNLIKNPTGANEVIKVIQKETQPHAICIVLNDREQDGTDISWIYDTQFEKIMDSSTTHIVCTGARAYDMALRFHYGNYQGELLVEENIEKAIEKTLSLQNHSFVIATYTALLPAREAIMKGMNL